MILDFETPYKKVVQIKPLVNHLTNYVTAKDCANTVLALGGNPLMADAIEEIKDMVSLASSLVINMGTLNKDKVASMKLAGQLANQMKIPIILDPVGVGASQFRTKFAQEMLDNIHFACIKGNASEILCLLGQPFKSMGVEAGDEISSDLKTMVSRACRKYKTVISITGKVDFISDGENSYELFNGHERLKQITGTGCMTTSMIATFLGAKVRPLEASIIGLALMNISGEHAYDETAGLASYKVALMDAFYTLTPKDLRDHLNIRKEV